VLKLQSINPTGCKNGIKQDASDNIRKPNCSTSRRSSFHLLLYCTM